MVRNLSIVIPVYNSQDTLAILVEEIVKVVEPDCEHYEIILVNDGSSDKSWEVIETLSKSYPHLHSIDLMRNYGQHNALLCGIRQAKYPVIVTMDDDLQHPPSEIPVLLQKLDEGYDAVYGVPEVESHTLWRNFTSVLIKRFLKKAMKVSNAQSISAFRAFRTEIREAFADYRGTFVSIDVLLSWGTTRFASVTVSHNKRLVGKSNYTVKKLFNHAFTLITGFSILPLQLASYLGFISMVFGLIVFIYVVIKFISSGGVVPGFTFLAATLAIFSGVQLFAIGMIGEYLGRLFTRSLDHPTYTIRTETSAEAPHALVDKSDQLEHE